LAGDEELPNGLIPPGWATFSGNHQPLGGKMRRVLAILLTVSLVLVGAAAATAQPITLKWGHPFKTDFVFGISAQKIADLIKERTKGQVVVEVLPNSQVGGYFQCMASAAQGTLDMAWTDGGSVGRFYPPSGVTEGAYLFKTVKQLQNFWDGPTGQKLRQGIYEEANLKAFSAFEYGTRQLTTSKKAVRTPADMKGLRLRCLESKVSMTSATAMGATPTPIDFAELYLALQQGIVDGQENPLPAIYSMKFYEVQKYLVLTSHLHQCLFPVMSRRSWEKLSPEQQKIITQVIEEVRPISDKMLNDLVAANLQAMKASGIEVIEPDVEAFRAQAVPIMLKAFEKEWYPGIYEEIKKTAF
jgi:TRAP-type transport system periplasmic protein